VDKKYTSTATPTGTGIITPTPTQTGMAAGCAKISAGVLNPIGWTLVESQW